MPVTSHAFLWSLFEATKDPALVQVLYRANGHSVEGLPYDLLAADPAAFQEAVAKVIAREGKVLARAGEGEFLSRAKFSIP